MIKFRDHNNKLGLINEDGVIVLSPQNSWFEKLSETIYKKESEKQKYKYELVSIDFRNKIFETSDNLYDEIYVKNNFIIGTNTEGNKWKKITKDTGEYFSYEYTNDIYDFEKNLKFKIYGKLEGIYNNIFLTSSQIENNDFSYYLYDEKGVLLFVSQDIVRGNMSDYFDDNIIILSNNKKKTVINTITKEVIFDDVTITIMNFEKGSVLTFNKENKILGGYSKFSKPLSKESIFYLENSDKVFDEYNRHLYSERLTINPFEYNGKVGIVSFEFEKENFYCKVIQAAIYNKIFSVSRFINKYEPIYFLCLKDNGCYDVYTYHNNHYELKETDIIDINFYLNYSVVIIEKKIEGISQLHFYDETLSVLLNKENIFESSIEELKTPDSNDSIIINNGKKQVGIFNLVNKRIVPQEFNTITARGKLYILSNDNGVKILNLEKNLYYLEQEKNYIKSEFVMVEKSNDNFVIIKTRNDNDIQYFILDSKTGKNMFENKIFKELDLFLKGKYIVKEGNEYSILDLETKEFTYKGYDKIAIYGTEIMILKKNNKFSFLDIEGKIIKDNVSNYKIEDFGSSQCISIYQGSKKGLIKSNTNMLPCEFLNISTCFKNGYFEVSKEIYNEKLQRFVIKKGIYYDKDYSFNEVVPCIFDELKLTAKTLEAYCEINDQKGQIKISDSELTYTFKLLEYKRNLSKSDIIYELNLKGYDHITQSLILEYIQENKIDISDIDQIELILSNIFSEIRIGNEEKYSVQ